jgi:hypothetical protein
MPSSSLTPPPHHSTLNRAEANAMDIDDDKLTRMKCKEEEECIHTEEAWKHLEEWARKIAEAKAAKRVKEEAECKKCKVEEKAEAEHKKCEATEKAEAECKQLKAEKREVECKACKAVEEETNWRIAEAKHAAGEAWKVKVVTAPSTNKVSSGVFLQVQVCLTGQQHKAQETVEVSNDTKVAPAPVSATIEAPETDLVFVEEEESTSSSSGASVHY